MPPLCGAFPRGIAMNEIKLDPKTLLGFKIITDGSAAKLSSPKIGDKDCVVSADTASAAVVTRGSLQAKIGSKLDIVAELD
jgi:hypothetical protein